MRSIFTLTIFAIIMALGLTTAEAGNKNNGSGSAGKDGGKGGGKDGGSKIAMCHDGETIMVSANRVLSHLDHGDFVIEEGSCCSATPTKPYPEPDNHLYEWDWRVCDWVSIKYCPPDVPAPGLRCEWCVKSCSWSCLQDGDTRWWGWQDRDCVWFTFGKEPLVTDNSDVNNQMINYPNPFSSEVGTSFQYYVDVECSVNLTIYNSMGQKVKILVDQSLSEGSHSIYWNGKDENGYSVESGVYLYLLKANGSTFTNKLIITN